MQEGKTMEEIIHISIRISTELHEKLKRLADSEKRSLTKQIVYILERGVDREGKVGKE
jgi:hypothetical protein